MAIRTHTVRDAGAPFEVDSFTRKVIVPNAERVIGVVGDDRSEQVTFKIPNVIDGHNMPRCNRKYVAWRNVEGVPGTDALAIVEETKDYAIYAWTVRDGLTTAKGIVVFSLHFECDDPKTGRQIYRWGTHTCSDCEILDSVNVILGAYKAIYIDGETLVFADYATVEAHKIDLTSCVVPKDTFSIKELGKQDVSRYAYAEVSDPNIKPENIKRGVKILGVEGTALSRTPEMVNVSISNGITEGLCEIYFTTVDDDGIATAESLSLDAEDRGDRTVQIVKGTQVVFRFSAPTGGKKITIRLNGIENGGLPWFGPYSQKVEDPYYDYLCWCHISETTAIELYDA